MRIHGLRNKVDGIYGTDPLGSPGLEAADPNYCADLTVTNNFIGPIGSHIVRNRRTRLPGGMEFRSIATAPTLLITRFVTPRMSV